MIRIFKTGPHAHRTPLSYPALAPLWEEQITLVDSPGAADLYVFAHVLDIAEAPPAMLQDWRARKRPVVLLSEEPFWDTIWGKRPMERLIEVDTPAGPLPVIQLSHQTCAIYRFDRIPYYLLTNPRFHAMYQARFARNAALLPQDWRRLLASRTMDVTFMFERRPEKYHAVHWPEGDLEGLCSWRTELAEACRWSGVERLGHSWQGGQSRLDLADWYGDKMERLDRRARLMGAIENTHQPDYLTEKFFDAFACGSVPFYVAAPGHRVHTLGLPPDSWLNLHGLSPEAAAERLRNFRPDSTVAEALAVAQTRLLTLLDNDTAWAAERARLKTAVLEALETVLAGGS
ncbi:glycosyltransferase family 10 [Alisedimentitalea sp. MJ-SS2]|uniref:glycosyltransferase family 10 domain-containing protein n=1 Tax=Aliisedimentitalea sp. MJ-SS2 TaxID=3049795 RepID=UPI002907328A|nr:glycosyltransferase family 10 [Alisedimentitalea sp. MJ-SS2]MDU8930017.1 glycosyltransferase family 10 [Alisedimentitalea sp. MJ-SS2]